MKKLYTLMLLIGLGLTGCFFDEGPPGPRGADGYDGYDGVDGIDGEESYVFEYELSFTAPDYNVLLNLPSNFNMLESDVILVFFLWEIDEDGTEIWRSLPQTLYFVDGLLEYNYDFTRYDASVFLDGTIPLDELGAMYTDNWIARLVVVPGQFANGRTSIDHSDYNAVKSFYNLPDSRLAKSNYVKRPMH